MVYFISDVHLGYFSGERNKELENLLLSFFNQVSLNAKIIAIIGDLFDFWFDYKKVIPKHFYKVVSKLSELKEKGIEIVYLIGNHDFGHYEFFRKELGIEVYEKDLTLELFGKKFYLSHGDGKIKNDYGYSVLKFILRNKVSRFLFRLVHPDLGIWLAMRSSRKSRVYTNKRQKKNFDSLFEFAKKKIDDGYDFVIMGHSHRAEYKEYRQGIYVNLGDWLSVPRVGIFDGNGFKLLQVEELVRNNIEV
ncbi:MAG: UDP-2,3-diacylglucosamine diphosphatase [Ignavibacteria bacterium]|nr:UDP-2,3-diacylglucosamine diphosphatase [Ignavibacteria bacterium]